MKIPKCVDRPRFIRAFSPGGRMIAAVLSFFWASAVMAEACPDGDASLVQVRNVINDLGKNNQAPAAADCGFAWAENMNFDDVALTDKVLINFFLEAADLNRRAYRKRAAAKLDQSAANYLDNEIALRKQFVEQVLKADPEIQNYQPLRRATTIHLSAMTKAYVDRKKYSEMADYLSRTPTSIIDSEAVRAWLQAVSSCDKFDGDSNINLCAVENKRVCQKKISAFLSSVDEMTTRTFPPTTGREIAGLRRLTADGGCLND